MFINFYFTACSPYKKGKTAFMGSIPIDEEGVPYCPVSTYTSDPIRDKKLEAAKQEIISLKKEHNNFNAMFELIADTNPAIREMLRKKKEAATAGTSRELSSEYYDICGL